MYEIPFAQVDKDEFLNHYWQKAPCLFQHAFESPPAFLSADELAGFCLEEDIESRLIQQIPQPAKWTIEHGPFDEQRFAELNESHWTLLLQSIDHWAPETRELLKFFEFIPRWRFDDIMVSYAVDQGGVGPHADNYDVFLIQGEGTRHWRVGNKNGNYQAKTIIQGMCHVGDFEPIIDVVMQPGDMLYIPPETPHWGISIGESIGYSVGYRSPQTHQMLALLTEYLSEKDTDQQFFSDQYRSKANYDNHFEPEVVQWAQQQLIKLSKQPKLLQQLLSIQLSYSKLGDVCDSNHVNIQKLTYDSKIQLQDDICLNWVKLENKIRLNIEGEHYDFDKLNLKAVQMLASFQPTPIKLFNISPVLVDFPPALTNLMDRGYLKLIS